MNPSPETCDNAVKVLSDTMRPWRPAELYHSAFVPTPGRPEPGIGREAERFRERLHLRRPEVVKRGPWFALKRWIDPVLPQVTELDFIVIPFNGHCLKRADRETIRRIKHMVIRNPNASEVARIGAALDGFKVEGHVKDYFRRLWPSSYLEASNHGVYDKPAPDDFSLIVGGKRYTVDVATSTQKYPVLWTLHGGKMKGAFLRIIAYYNEQGVVMQGFTWKKDDVVSLWPIERLIARLNIQEMPDCIQHFEDIL